LHGWDEIQHGAGHGLLKGHDLTPVAMSEEGRSIDRVGVNSARRASIRR
jgi:hypothetical protein